MTIDEMIEVLEEEHECAGYANYYERVLKGKTYEEIKSMYEEFIKWRDEAEKEYLKEREEALKEN